MDEKPSIFGKIRSAFVEDIPDKGSKPSPTPSRRQSVETAPRQSTKLEPTGPLDKASVDTLVERFTAKVEKSEPSVCKAFKDQYNKLDVIPDTTLRTKAALRSSGVSLEDLLKALEDQAQVATQVLEDFRNSAKSNESEAFAELEQLQKSIHIEIDVKESSLAALRTSIQELEMQASEIEGKIDIHKRQYARLSDNAAKAHALMMGTISDQIKHLKTFEDGK